MRNWVVVVLVLAHVLVCSNRASAQCVDWATGFGPGNGVNGQVLTFLVRDVGGEQQLCVGGNFTNAGGAAAAGVAAWNGSEWTTFGAGLGTITALAVYDDGAGPALYAGGQFTTVAGTVYNRIAKWNGSQWTPLGAGFGNNVTCMTVYDDGSGPELFVGGSFLTVDGVATQRLASWNGTRWRAFPVGFNADPNAMLVYDGMLHVGGPFTSAGGVAASRVARWNGTTWSPLAGGTNQTVNCLAVFGGSLYVGGLFTFADSHAANYIARWNGTTWSSLGTGNGGGGGANNPVLALAPVTTPQGTFLYAGGTFSTVDGNIPASLLARWSGSAWSSLGGVLLNNGAQVRTITEFTDPQGAGLFVGGLISTAGGQPSQNFARWGDPCSEPSIVTHPVDVTPVFGQVVTFSVVARGTAPLSYQWRRNGAPLMNGGRISGATTAQLTLSSWSLSDEGNYDVVVTNTLGVATSDAAVLDIDLGGLEGAVPVEVIMCAPAPIPAPGSGTYTEIFDPLLSESGAIAFLGRNLSARSINLWSPDLGVSYLYGDGGAAPGMPPGVTFAQAGGGLSTFMQYTFAGERRLCFTSDVQGPDTNIGNRRAMWYRDDEGTELIVRAGAPAPGAGGLLFWRDFNVAMMNSAGRLAVFARLTPTPNGVSAGLGVWTWDRPTGWNLVMRTGVAVPGISGLPTFIAEYPLMTESGSAIIATRFDTVTGFHYDGLTDSLLLRANPDGSVSVLVKSGDPAPGFAPGVGIQTIYETEYRQSPSGDVVFQASVAGPASFQAIAYFRTTPNGLERLVTQGDLAPGVPDGRTVYQFSWPVLNSAGSFIFNSRLTQPSGTPPDPTAAVWLVSDGVMEPIIVDEDPVPGMPPGTTFEFVNAVALNDAGQMLVNGSFNTPNTAGLFGWTRAHGLFPIAVTGSQVEVSPGVYRTAQSIEMPGSVGNITARETRNLGQDGTIVLRIRFTDQSVCFVRTNFDVVLGEYLNCPVVDGLPASIVLRAGQTLTLDARVLGAAPVSLQWMRDAQPLADSATVSGATTERLEIAPVTLADAGVYVLTATNECGSGESATVQVTVRCGADWDLSGEVGSQDFFDFIVAFFEGDADFNEDGVTTSQDFFDFLVAFFTPC